MKADILITLIQHKLREIEHAHSYTQEKEGICNDALIALLDTHSNVLSSIDIDLHDELQRQNFAKGNQTMNAPDRI